MDGTVQPEREIDGAHRAQLQHISSTGLMTTPPPMPQMAPTMLDKES